MASRAFIWVCVAFASCMLTSTSFAQSQFVRWQGQTILEDSSGCDDVGAIDNFPAEGVYRAKLEVDEPNSALLINFGRGAIIIQTTDQDAQLHGNGKYKGTVITGSVTYRSAAGNYNFAITPATVTANTKTVKLAGTISNFNGVKGCTIEISGSYKRF